MKCVNNLCNNCYNKKIFEKIKIQNDLKDEKRECLTCKKVKHNKNFISIYHINKYVLNCGRCRFYYNKKTFYKYNHVNMIYPYEYIYLSMYD